MWYRLFQFWLQVAFTVGFNMRVMGRGNVPAGGGVIVASNHQSYADPLILGAGVQRPLYFMARKSLFQQFFLFSWLIRSLHAFPVARDRGDLGAVRETLRQLRRGAAVLAFPEATRTHTGEIGELKRGIFAIAIRAGAPVVPTVIDGAFEAWPRTQLLPRPTKIAVVLGKPLLPGEFGGDSAAMARACHQALLGLQRQAKTSNTRSAKWASR